MVDQSTSPPDTPKSVSPASSSTDAAPLPLQELLLWRALSEVFLDNEKTVFTYKVIANALIASGADRATMRRTLIDDVAPHLMGNLQTTAGEWMGWDDDTLLYGMEMAAMRRTQSRWPWDKDRRVAVQYARSAWDKIAVHLPIQLSNRDRE